MGLWSIYFVGVVLGYSKFSNFEVHAVLKGSSINVMRVLSFYMGDGS